MSKENFMLIDTRRSPHGGVWTLPQKNITWLNGLWQEVFERTGKITIPHILTLFEDKEAFHQVENFRIAAGESEGSFKGTPYGDGDMYKLLEGLMTYASRTQDAQALKTLDHYIDLIGRAQQEDGYLSTKQIIGEREQSGATRLGDIEDFEIYNFGHLFTAACMHKRLFGTDAFLNIALKAAHYLDTLYHEAARTGEVQTAVCPSHYMGLVELYRTTGDKRWLNLAQLAINLRDKIQSGTDDNQDRLPLREHDKILGHAVRSTYLYAGCADVCLETGEEALLSMLDKVWDNMANKKLYLTGGCGALYNGVSPYGMFPDDQKTHQAFGYEYQLPNVTAYNETCGTLGNIMWNYRMFALKQEVKYFDLIERSMLNLALASVSLSGDKYFYENMLRRAKQLDYPLRWPLERAHFIECFCCPTNVSRFLMQAMEYLYMVKEDTVMTGLYGASEATIALDNGARFTLIQQTGYPWDGDIHFSFQNSNGKAFNMQVRVPGWCTSGIIIHNGKEQALTAKHAGTYVDVGIENPEQDSLLVRFDMPVRLTTAHALVEENINQVAVERGPLVYCVETPDAAIDTLDHLMLPYDAKFTQQPFDIGNTKVIALETETMAPIRPNHRADALYETLQITGFELIKTRFIPYFAWDNRGYGEMRIWMPLLLRHNSISSQK
jgi:DUF1680 family protein